MYKRGRISAKVGHFGSVKNEVIHGESMHEWLVYLNCHCNMPYMIGVSDECVPFSKASIH